MTKLTAGDDKTHGFHYSHLRLGLRNIPLQIHCALPKYLIISQLCVL